MMKGFKNKETKHQKMPKDFNIDFEEIQIPTNHNCSLYGWWMLNNESLPTIILVHGWGRNVERMMPYIQHLNNHFNLLTFDSRNHGNSDKDKISTMVKFAEDISASIDFLLDDIKISNREIGVIGLSIGGAATIYAAAKDSRINNLITVGAFANPLDVMKSQLKKRRVPYSPLGWLLLNYLQLIIGFRFNTVAPENQIHQINAPILIIHGKKDVTIPVSHAERLNNLVRNEFRNLWIIPSRGHSDCHKETGYWDRILLYYKTTHFI